MILDTSFIIDLLQGDSSAVEKLDELEERGEVIFLTPVNAFELHYGAKKHGNEEELEEIELILGSARILDIEWKDGLRAAELLLDLEKDGEMIEVFDVVTAVIAKKMDEKVLTRNVDHFKRVEGLEVEAY